MIPLMTEADCRRHIAWKRDGERTLATAVADRMLAALDAGAPADYQQLKMDALWPEPPIVVFHTAPASAHDLILTEGLRPADPNEGNWSSVHGMWGFHGAAGVYVAAVADTVGRWTHWPEWDIWAVVDHRGLTLERDLLNPACWYIAEPVRPQRIAHVATHTARVDA